MAKININNITPNQILKIETGLLYYKYIMDGPGVFRRQPDPKDKDFREVFTSFYLSSLGLLKNPNLNDAFFNAMEVCQNRSMSFLHPWDVVKILNNHLGPAVKPFQFSFATKIIHTLDPNLPIYDSKIRDYLRKNEGQKFLFDRRKDKTSNNLAEATIGKDWETLKKWYENFLKTNEAKEWIKWFDNQFSGSRKPRWISPVKKIDFIIWACSD